MLLAGGILCGIPWGVLYGSLPTVGNDAEDSIVSSSTLAAAYASEVCPLTLRPYLTGWINCCVSFEPP